MAMAKALKFLSEKNRQHWQHLSRAIL